MSTHYSHEILPPRFKAARYRWPEPFRFRHVLPSSPFEITSENASDACPAGTYVRIGARTAKRCTVFFSGQFHIGPEPGVIYPPAALIVSASVLPSL